jgi:hypothetical protein
MSTERSEMNHPSPGSAEKLSVGRWKTQFTGYRCDGSTMTAEDADTPGATPESRLIWTMRILP